MLGTELGDCISVLLDLPMAFVSIVHSIFLDNLAGMELDSVYGGSRSSWRTNSRRLR